MSVKFPYRAVICGEEHIVKGWQGRKLITNNGNYLVGHIYGDWRLQTHRIFEVATIQLDNQGSWLVNGKPFSVLEHISMGVRLSSISRDENLRVYKDKIFAAAWIDTGNATRVTELLDEIAKFWKTATLPTVKSNDEEPSLSKALGILSHGLLEIQRFKELFKPWSAPIWLTEFSQEKLLPANSKKISPLSPIPITAGQHFGKIQEIKNNSGKKFAEFNKDFSVAVIKGDSGEKNIITIEPELRKLIKKIIEAGGYLPRTELRKDKTDTWQPEKLLNSKNARLLIKFDLLGTKKSGRTTVFWAKRCNN